MKKHLVQTMSALAFTAAFLIPSLPAAQTQVSTMGTYTHSDGASYFEFGLQAPQAVATVDNEVVFLFDTSAGQVGQAREDQFRTLKEAIAALPEGTKVQLLAVDVKTEAFTSEFVDSQSAELLDAISALEDQRIPLGATDLENGVKDVVSTFARQGGPDAKRTAIYLGSGRSAGRLVSPAKFQGMVDQLTAEKISFTSCPFGVASDMGLIGALASQTGGVLVTPQDIVNQLPANSKSRQNLEQIAGTMLAQSVETTVLWPDAQSQKLPAGWDIYPANIPPVRSDRETILLGKTSKALNTATISLTATDVDGNSRQLSWNMKATPSDESNQYLVGMVKNASSNGGATLPLAGRTALETLKSQLDEADASILAIAENALGTGQVDAAQKIAQNVNRRNGVASDAADDLLSRAATVPQAAPQTTIDAHVNSMSIRTQSLANTVNNAIADAERLMMKEKQPEVALQHLKLMKAEIMQETQLPPAERNKLIDRLETKIKTAYRETQIRNQWQIEVAAAEAERESKALAAAAFERKEEKVKQILERFEALVAENRYFQAQATADVAAGIIPNITAPRAGALWAQVAGYVSEIEQLKEARQRGFVDVLMSVERSFVPLSDEPPMLYPAPEIWRALSERRKKQYEVMDLSNTEEEERKIREALDMVLGTDTEFTINGDGSQTLQELAEQIRSSFNIIVEFDTKAMEETDATPDATFDGNYSGIQFRKALKRILSKHELVYCIRDDCLLISTPEGVQKQMPIKVYPVGDIVVSPMPMGGGMGGGMMGGMGGMGGGMRGGMGGGMYNMPSKYEKLLKASLLGQGIRPNTFYAVPAKKAATAPTTPATPAPKTATNIVSANPTRIGKINVKSLDMNHPELYWDKIFSAYSTETERFEQQLEQQYAKEITLLERQNVQDEQRKQQIVQLKQQREEQRSQLKQQQEKDVALAVAQILGSSRSNPKMTEQVVALIHSAIKHGDVQPWMYEVLAVALMIQDAPKEDIERAILSAKEFSTSPVDLLNLAVYLQHFGSNDRALEIYGDLAEAMPMRPEPLAHALRLAGLLQDEESAKKLCLASVSQAWDGRWGKKVFETACDLADATIANMRLEGRDADAEQFRAEMDEALKRDCLVIVEYLGDAELDLYVKEPNDTYCWYMNPRTTSGGILLKNVERPADQSKNQVVYVCPKAFAGDYEVLVQRDCGKVANNKFHVTIYLNYGTDQATEIKKYFDLDEENGSLVKFHLENGRLNESYNDATIEAALLNETEIENRMNVAKQIAAFSSKAPLGEFNNSPSTTKGGGSKSIGGSTSEGGATSLTTANSQVDDQMLQEWVYRRTAANPLGYQVNVQSVFDGPSLMVSGLVVSADRRYVRMSPQPMFQAIKSVFTYNPGTGTQTNTSGQYGGGGMGGMSGGMGGMGGGYGGGMGGGMGGGGYGGGMY